MEATKALSAPSPRGKFVPTGGVDSNNLDEFLACDKIAAVGGSFFVKLAMQGGK
jgi:2-dehydro-3-deoxyphosphogluconate aldolase/(4S)-4-hydroxy-2-oxoglutarate aldolase